MSDRRPLATSAEVAAYLRRTVGTLANWRYQGVGPTWIKTGGAVRYRWSDIERWLESQAHGGAA